MAKLLWSAAVKQRKGNLVKVSTRGAGYGSGFIIPTPANARGNCCVLTAFHVIKNAYETGATIDISLVENASQIELPSLVRNIFVAKDRDQALIVFNGPRDFGKLKSFNFMASNSHYESGAELGWLGFPGIPIANDVPCFLSGRVSAFLPNIDAYLIDGVSIHGISGGPVFYCDNNGKVVIAGIVTNYYPNQVNNQSWPGLAMFRTISPVVKLYEAQGVNPSPELPYISQHNPMNPPAGGSISGDH